MDAINKEEGEAGGTDDQYCNALPTPQTPIDTTIPIGNRLQHHRLNWASITSDPWVLSTLEKGYLWEFSSQPPLSNSPRHSPATNSPDLERGMDDLLSNMLHNGAIEEVRNPHTPGHYSRWFAVPKKEPGKWRAILDLSFLNLHIKKESFKMETAEIVRQHLKQGEWMSSLDITDAYHHVPVRPAYRKYLRFTYKRRVYHYCCLPMGLCTACHGFNRLIKVVKAFLAKQGIQLHQYLDDWLLHTQNHNDLQYITTMVVQLTQQLGFIINLKKSELLPAQVCTFLSYRFNLVDGLVHPTEERWTKIQAAITRILQLEAIPARTWQSLLGLLAATERVVRLGMLNLRPIQRSLVDQWSPWHGDPKELLTLPDSVKTALRWWTSRENVMSGVCLQSAPPEVHIFTDSSTEGWGGHWENMEVAGKWTQQEQLLHINALELLAIWRTLEALLPVLTGKTILVATDNTTALAYINKQGGTKSPTLLRLTQDFYHWLDSTSITLRCRHVPGALNIRADSLSRGKKVAATEWSLHPEVTKTLWEIWGTPLVDMFATAENTKLPLYYSPILDPKAIGVDALSAKWTGDLYMFPPTALLNKVLLKLQQEPCVVTLIAPAWPQQPWYPLLLAMLVDWPIQLPDWPRLLKQPRSDLFHPNPQIYKLHAWRLSNRPSLQKAFLETLRRQWQDPRKYPQYESTTQSGKPSALGVKLGMPIHSKQM